MERLREVSKRLGNPGQEKLYTAARKRGIAVTRIQIKQYLTKKPERQIFRPLPRSLGATGAESLDSRWQMDLIQFSTAPSKVGREVLKEVFFTRGVGRALPAEDARRRGGRTAPHARNTAKDTRGDFQ